MITETAMALRATKTSNIILDMVDLFGITIETATDIFYNSITSQLIEDGVADLQCRSNKYLATLIWEEHLENCTH